MVITGFSNNIFTGEYTGGSGANLHAKWSGDSIPSMSYGMQVYLLKSLYDSLHEHNKVVARSHAQGLVILPYAEVIDGVNRFRQSSIVECFQPTCYISHPDITPPPVSILPEPEPDPCEGVTCDPKCVGVDRYEMVCKDGVCVRGALMEANSTECGYVKPECGEGDKKPGHVCVDGKWKEIEVVPLPHALKRLYVKFAIPWLDLLPGIPYEPWMIIPPGFEIVEG